ncbi:response regulator [uncultured Sphingomonas sp.]|uniref:response regulator n=1 Tax=uncultured Sphingomonas sp. TaxID=158754 RepID=UPI0025EFD36A|nr:response regulator [uncultured Sphingomonas sp.]
MPERTPRACRILIVEDEYMIADQLRRELEQIDFTVLGPVSTVEDALDLIRSEPQVDGAILDINLAGEQVFPVAERLAEQGVPFLFATGYDHSAIPERFAGVQRCEKPFRLRALTEAIGRVILS